MSTNLINTFAKNHNLKVSDVTVDKMNSIIFSTTFIPTLCGSDIVKDGDKVFRINVAANTSDKITPATLAKEAKDALISNDGSNLSSVGAAVQFGLIKKLVLSRSDKGTNGRDMSVASFAKYLGLKVVDVAVDVQNDIIFETQGVKQIEGLDIHDGKYFKLDTVANTATLIDAAAVADQAKEDLVKGKTTNLTAFAQAYNLISSITFAAKSADA